MSKTLLALTALVLACTDLVLAEKQDNPPPCGNDIYCYGPLLHTVQMAELFADSKTFVDMKMKKNRETTLALFEEMMIRTDNKPTPAEVGKFVSDSFDPAGSEFEPWDPTDWKQSPKFLEKIADQALKGWGSALNDLWKFLGRKMKDDVRINSDLYSIIYVPNPVIVPGGRFREFYYWDSYWIVRGLILSEMYDTVKGMLENFLSIVDTYGFIPNGGRLYYLMRSQPPLLTPMVESYVAATGDLDFLEKNIATLEKEYNFWMSNHTVRVEKDDKLYTLVRYNDVSSGPRPESYREDIQSAEFFKTNDEKQAFYSELKTAAESGWDFSSRWFITNGTNKGNLTDMKVKSIVPVDLNAIVYWNGELLSKFFERLGRPAKALKYRQEADQLREAVKEILWHEEVGAWLDYDMINNVKRDYFYPTNVAPLWTGCYDPEMKDYYLKHVLDYLKRSQVMNNQGGLPSTTSHTGEQWDYPNAWPPLQHMVIMALDGTGDVDAKNLAFEMARRWVMSNYKAYNSTTAMFEKYDATVVGGHGGGGEYEVQFGFGWSNGVIMELLAKYGDRLSVSEIFKLDRLVSSENLPPSVKQASFLSIVLAQAAVAASCIGAVIYIKRFNPKRNQYTKLPSDS
ncbi:alpha,alpha-trehalase [Nesidiocoris tenuis]|uniref:Trehalase n=1 Tax=Nesidiocoris tenuis TaxID=355587 RepID=A0ABN7AWX1_9HEMI|nr:alpha,alpha-trehalase [Nesidiocoris tenuis]